MIKAVFFDFGGVIAEEGWEKGLNDIANYHKVAPVKFFDDACDVLWNTGYMYGKATEEQFWAGLSERYDFKMTVDEMRQQIFDRFVIRKPVLELIEEIGRAGYRLGILSDQTNWLDVFNEEHKFFPKFEKVYNSYHLGKGKKHPEVFGEVCADFGEEPSDVLFVDDNAGHIERATDAGMQVYHFIDWENDIKKIEELLKL